MTKMINAPRIVIGATGSGRGKTTFVSALLALLKKKNMDVHAFKSGPDYIDPMFHEAVLGIPSKNMDAYFAGEEILKASFAESCGEINIVEGAMGLYDGIGLTSQSSAYELAGMLKAPVILCVDAHGMGTSIVAEIKGFQCMDTQGLIKGVFLNRMSTMYFKKIAPYIEEQCGISVVGHLPKSPEAVLSSRHLGLMTPEETDANEKFDLLAAKLEESLDLEKLLAVARSAEDLDVNIELQDLYNEISYEMPAEKPVIAVARDEAFSFFYRDNITALEMAGAEVKFFSPMRDKTLPEGTSGILLIGGYPELYAKELSDNVEMRTAIKEAALDGMPLLAECGGFMYLQETLTVEAGCFDMVGLFKGGCQNMGKLIRFGYISAAPKSDPDMVVRGHEFHHFDVDDPGTGWDITQRSTGKVYEAMQVMKNVTAGFPHFYYFSNVKFVCDFVKKAASYDK